MDNLRIECQDRKNNEIIRYELSSLEGESLALNEFDFVRLCHDGSRTELDVFIGSLKLACFEEDGYTIYSLDGTDSPFFRQLFLNNFGQISIQVWEKSRLHSNFFVELASPKITIEEQELWLEKIQQIFPISNIGFDLSPMSNIKVDFSNSYGFFSYSSFANELLNFLKDQAKNFSRPGFLKVQFSAVTSIGNEASMDQAKHHLWLSSHMLWKQTKPNLSSLVKRNIMAYEPVKYPSKKTITNYNTDLNRRLLFRLKEASVLLSKFFYDCKNIDTKDLRTQFETRESKSDFININLTRLQLCNEITGKLINDLEGLGVKAISGDIKDDSRFGELTQNVIKLERLLMPLRKLSILHKSLLAIPSNDLLFEYFCYGLMVETLKSQGFVICATGSGSPVPFYIKFIRNRDGCELTIFYDQTIPKIGRRDYFHPLVDKNRSSTRRPDFIFHLKSNDFHSTFIVDAKFKKLTKCLKDNFGSKLNADHIVGKYTSGISQLGSFGRPPFFILGICLADNNKNTTVYNSGLHNSVELFSQNSPLIQSGAIGIGYKDTEELRSFFSKAIDFHKLLAINMPLSEPLSFVLPKEEPRGPMSYNNRKSSVDYYTQMWSHKAPSLTGEDAAEIKGMLARGDKPQDIAFYYGVNNGRISEIKSGAKFLEIVPKHQNLPPAGPYPPLRNFILQ
ncbi:hypothetical protein N9B84_04600 [Amylibacter sp.]|nr:hypothetical protein [Amylibacter sp.]